MMVIYKHELRTCWRTFTAYVFGAFLLVMVGYGAMLYNLTYAVSNFEYVLSFSSIIFVILVPLLTMRVIAEERKQKTDQLLYSLPVSTTQVVLGKYFALLTTFLIPMVIVAIYPVIFSHYGEVYLPTSYGSMVAFFLLGAGLIAIGTFISSLTENQGLAAGITIAVVLFNYYSVSLSEYVASSAFGSLVALYIIALLLGLLIWVLTRNSTIAYALCFVLILGLAATYFIDNSLFEGLVPSIMAQLSLFKQLTTFVTGVFDLTGVTYYLSVIVFFLFLTVQSMEKRRYN